MSSPGAETPTVWLGSAGTGTSHGLAKTLREVWGDRVRIVAADVNPGHLVGASLVADRFVQVPYSAAAEFPSFMVEALVETRTTLYVPILDEEILWAARARDEGILPRGVEVIAPPTESAAICFDKERAATWMDERELPTPKTWSIARARWTGEPLFAKPRLGRGSIGARSVSSQDHLEALNRCGEDLVVQEACEGPEVTVDAVRWAGGTRAVARERLEVKAGVCTKARLFESSEMESLATRLGDELALRGAFCFQVMRLAGRWVITDINPRPGAGTRLTVAAGVNVLAAMFADFLGGAVEPYLGRLDGERFAVRHYVEYVTV